MKIAGKNVGAGYPCFVIAEAGINHNGDLKTALALVRVAAEAGCDAVKFQKRAVDVCVPPEQRDQMRETPWGTMRYVDYKRRIEFDDPEQWRAIIDECDACGLIWMASAWDEPSVAFLEQLNPPAHKIASASITDHALLRFIGSTKRPVIMSTGMSTSMQIIEAVAALKEGAGDKLAPRYEPGLALLHCNSSYPCEPRDCNLMAMHSLRHMCDAFGWSGHERGLQISVAAVAMGASIIERHITLDRTQWGTDHAASLEPKGIAQLVRDIRIVEEAMGDGVKRVTESEVPVMKKLRRLM